MPGAKGSAKQFKPMSMRWLACVDKVTMHPLTKTAGVHGLFSTIDLSLVSATSGRSVTVPKTATIWADAVCIWIPALVQPAAIGNGDLNGNDGTDAGKATNCRVAIDVISREKN